MLQIFSNAVSVFQVQAKTQCWENVQEKICFNLRIQKAFFFLVELLVHMNQIKNKMSNFIVTIVKEIKTLPKFIFSQFKSVK